MTRKIKAVIFDMDGLIIDSEPLWRKAEIASFASIGYQFTDEMCSSTKGMRIDEVVSHWHEKLKWKSPSKSLVVDDITQRMINFIKTHGKALPGVEFVLDTLRNKNIPTALASSSPIILIETVLKTLQIKNYFDVIHSAEFEKKGKPDPQVFLTTSNKLGVEPINCLVLEDSMVGMKAGLNAQMRTIVIPEINTPKESWQDEAYCVLNSLNDFNLNLLN